MGEYPERVFKYILNMTTRQLYVTIDLILLEIKERKKGEAEDEKK